MGCESDVPGKGHSVCSWGACAWLRLQQLEWWLGAGQSRSAAACDGGDVVHSAAVVAAADVAVAVEAGVMQGYSAGWHEPAAASSVAAVVALLSVALLSVAAVGHVSLASRRWLFPVAAPLTRLFQLQRFPACEESWCPVAAEGRYYVCGMSLCPVLAEGQVPECVAS